MESMFQIYTMNNVRYPQCLRPKSKQDRENEQCQALVPDTARPDPSHENRGSLSYIRTVGIRKHDEKSKF